MQGKMQDFDEPAEFRDGESGMTHKHVYRRAKSNGPVLRQVLRKFSNLGAKHPCKHRAQPRADTRG